MSNILWKSLVVSPAVLGATLLVSGAALASGNSTTPVVVKTEVSQAKSQEASATTFQPQSQLKQLKLHKRWRKRNRLQSTF